MKRFFNPHKARHTIFAVLAFLLAGITPVRAQWNSVNIDIPTTTAMTAALFSEYQVEKMSLKEIQEILDEYSAAEVATAGIFLTKWMDRKALKNAGLFSSEENYYYRRIYDMVSHRIMPKIWAVANMAVKHPDKALFWGPYLYKTTTEVKELCMQFETVVTNGHLSFKDIAWLAINDDLLFLFDLAQLGNVDWKDLWNNLSDIDLRLAKEDLMLDLDNLLDAGSALAGAGMNTLDSLWVNASKVGGVFKMKPKEIVEMGEDFADIYNTLSDPNNVKDLLLGQIGSADSLGVANMFKFDTYNINQYINDYTSQLTNRYYKQRWYIYYQDSGTEEIINYSPDASIKDNITYGRGEWTRFDGDANFTLSASQIQQIKARSESYAAGWSQARVNELNASQSDYTYYIYYYLNSYYIWRGDKNNVIAHSYAYDIVVRRTWNHYGEVYEDWFDSQTMDEKVFEAHMQQKLVEAQMNDQINNNSDYSNHDYKIGKDSKQYYSKADAEKLNGCYTVSFVMECEGGAKLGEGSFQWKVNPHHSPLNNDSKEYAMSTSLEEGEGLDTSTYDAKIDELQQRIYAIDAEITTLKANIKNWQSELGMANPSDYSKIREKIRKAEDQISSLESERKSVNKDIEEVSKYRDELINDYAGETDDVYRIPAVMREIASAYQITWVDEGTWSGYTFIRRGKSPNLMSSIIEFRAELKKVRGESWFLFIRYHRSILGVDWTLTTDYNSKDVIDIMTFGDDTSAEERAKEVTARQKELMEEHPGCTIDLEYEYNKPTTVEDNDDSIHLLWVSDRLAIAREVDHKLTKIYANLVLLEKYLYSKQSIESFLKGKLNSLFEDDAWQHRNGNAAFRRWRESTYNAINKSNDNRE